jgi:N-acetylglucosaminyl-diphospho-decaprenol L-rhamnosyltransferase
VPGHLPEQSVIIVNYNGGDYIGRAVNSLKKQTFQDFELIIIDNASTDGSIDAINLSGLPSVQLIRMDENLGFAAGNNRAAEYARGKWLVLMNPDVVAEPDWLEKLNSATNRHPGTKVFTSAQFSLDEPDLMDGAGDAYLIFGIPWRGGFGHPRTALPDEGECFSPCGAAMMIQSSLFNTLNGFDERYFCYCEDVDLGFRANLIGESCVFVPDAKVYHAGSAVSGLNSEFTIYHGTRNRIWTYAKNTPWPLLVLTMPVHVALNLYLLVRSAAIGRFSATAKGLRDGLLGVGAIWSSDRWNVTSRPRSWKKLFSHAAWNPWFMSSRKPHIVPIRQAEHSRGKKWRSHASEREIENAPSTFKPRS